MKLNLEQKIQDAIKSTMNKIYKKQFNLKTYAYNKTFELYEEATCPVRLLQMPAKGMIVSSSLT